MTYSNFCELFRQNIKDLMSEKSITQIQLAEKLGVTRGTISRYISGERLPSVDVIVNMCFIFECDLIDLIPDYEMVGK